MGKARYVGFGDIIMRLSPEGYYKFAQADRFVVNYTGAEGNVAVALSYMGMDAAMVTKLPDNDIGRCAARKLDQFRVDTGNIVYGGERIGLYYLERGASQRPSKVIYDRKHSSFTTAEPDEFVWDEIFREGDWFHFSGITAALSDNCAEICRRACEAAKRKNVTVSCDLNYRKNLWTPQKAQETMCPMMKYVDVLFSNEEDCDKVLGIKAEDTDVRAGKLQTERYVELAEKLTEAFAFKKIAITLRESISATINNWAALLYAGGKAYSSKKYTMHIIDRVGGGDSFAAGMIYALSSGMDDQMSVDFAAAASCLKHSIELDYNLSTVEEVMALVGGDGSGRVER